MGLFVFAGVGAGLTGGVSIACAAFCEVSTEPYYRLHSLDRDDDPRRFDELVELWNSGRPVEFADATVELTPYRPRWGARAVEVIGVVGELPDCDWTTLTEEELVAVWPRFCFLYVLEAGWPMPALQACVREDTRAVDEIVVSDGILVGDAVVPLRPRPIAFLVGTAFWGGLAFIGYRRCRPGPTSGATGDELGAGGEQID